jgi:hypothetical protein
VVGAQELMGAAIFARSEALAAGLRVVLDGFHSQKRLPAVDSMLLRLYEPILFRNTSVANPAVRCNALKLLFDAFPLMVRLPALPSLALWLVVRRRSSCVCATGNNLQHVFNYPAPAPLANNTAAAAAAAAAASWFACSPQPPAAAAARTTGSTWCRPLALPQQRYSVIRHTRPCEPHYRLLQCTPRPATCACIDSLPAVISQGGRNHVPSEHVCSGQGRSLDNIC